MSDEKDKKQGDEKKDSFIDAVEEAEQRGAATAAYWRGRGLPQPGQILPSAGASPGSGSEAPASVTNKALELLDKGVVRAEAAADAKREDIKEAQKEANTAKEALYKTQFDTLKMVTEDYKETIKGLKAGGSPMTATQILEEGDKLIDAIMKRMPRPEPVAGKTEMSGDLQVRLLEMQHQHDAEMRRLDIEISKINQEFSFKKAEFDDKKDREWLEYKDKKDFRESGMGGLSDLLGSIAQNITQERETTTSVTKTAASQPGEKVLEAHIQAFPCQQCQSSVTVKDGEAIAICDQCGAEYKIEPKVK